MSDTEQMDSPIESNAEQGSLEEAMEQYAKQTTPDAGDTPTEDAKAEAEPKAEPDAEESDTADEESDDAAAEPEEKASETVEIEGKSYEVPKDVKAALTKQSADYAAKTAAVDAQLATAKKMVEIADKIGEVKGELKLVDQQLAQYAAVNWQQLRQQDPQAFTLHMLDYQALQAAREKTIGNAKSLQGAMDREGQNVFSERRAEMEKECRKAIPGWSDALGTKVTEYALQRGYKVEELQSLTDARVVTALNKARQYDELVKSKDAVIAKAQAAPKVTKPGSQRAGSKVAEARERFSKSNSLDDAFALYNATH
jgi:hypothetical protein